MTRRKSREKRPRVKRSDQHVRDVLAGDLIALRSLAAAYDSGETKVATALAPLIQNIVTLPSRAAVEARGLMVFPSSEGEVDQTHMNSYHRLVAMELGGEPPSLSFVPAFKLGGGVSSQPFRVWWSTEPIYVASIAVPGIPLGVIPLRQEEQLSWDEREKLTRQQFVADVRNTVGAHTDEEIPALLNDLYDAHSFAGGAQISVGDGRVLSLDDGSLPVRTAPAEAALRQIAEEVLVAYGQRLETSAK